MGAAWETAAFSLRTMGAHHQQEMQYALWGQLLFLLAPLCKRKDLDRRAACMLTGS